MPPSRKIGFYCGEDKITIIEMERNNLLQVFSFQVSARSESDSPFSSELAGEIQIISGIQKALRDHHIEGTQVHLALPVKDIILRSFAVPVVRGSELNAVVEFEVKKYLPFELKDLLYVFHSVPFVDDKVKRLRIIFFAIRKEVLFKYERMFKQAGLDIVYSEPSAVCLTKSLIHKKDIRKEDKVSFLRLEAMSGQICFIDRGLPQFIREFQTTVASDSASEQGEGKIEQSNRRIFNEVRNSFDFYSRQFTLDKKSKMFVVAPEFQQEYLETVAEDLSVDVRRYAPTLLAGTVQVNEMDALYALGACLNQMVPNAPAFNFSQKESVASVTHLAAGGASLSSYKSVLRTFLICAALTVGAYVFSQYQLKSGEQQLAELSAQQAEFATMAEAEIQAKVKNNEDKIVAYKEIRLKSELSNLLVLFSSILPEGVWLNGLGVQYVSEQNNAIRAEITGSVYSEDPNQQIRIVNDLVLALKRSKELGKFIKKVTLGTIQRNEGSGVVTTTFGINCS